MSSISVTPRLVRINDLEIGDEEPFISRTLKGAPEMGERVTEHLLDGQQRLTALWRGLHNNYDDRTFFVYLTTDEESGVPYYVNSISNSVFTLFVKLTYRLN